MKKWLLLVIALFGLSLIIGIYTPPGNFDTDMVTGPLADMFRNLSPGLLFLFILLKNITALLMTFVMSPILCLMPVFSIIGNGWLIGFLATEMAARESLGWVLAGLLPHGIIELPAFFIGEAAALSFAPPAPTGLISSPPLRDHS